MGKVLGILFCYIGILLFGNDIRAQVITTFAGGGVWLGDGGLATAAAISNPVGSTFDRFGDFYFADEGSSRIRRIDTAGVITTVAGTGSPGYNGDGIQANIAMLRNPCGVAFDSRGNLYITDAGNHRIRKVDLMTGIITTVVGTGIAGYNGDNIPATTAKLFLPADLCFDKFDNMFISDGSNYRVRKVDTFGMITTYAGTGDTGISGDGGPAVFAKFKLTVGMAIDDSGNLYVADWNGGNIRKVNTSGIISTVGGTGLYTYNGDSIVATNANMTPVRIALSKSNELFIADIANNRIRKIDLIDGYIYTVAGNGMCCYNGDNGPATAAEIGGPNGISMDDCGNIYISQVDNPRIRKVTFHPNCFPENVKDVNTENEVSIYPNPAKEQLNIECSSGIKELRVMNTIGQVLIVQKNYSDKAIIDVSNLSPGLYFIKVTDKNGADAVQRFVKE